MKSALPVLILLIAVFASLPALEGSGRDLDHVGNIKRLWGQFLPPDFSIWRELLKGLFETFQIAFLATTIASVLSLPLSILGSARLSKTSWVVRSFLAGVRTIPGLVWALLAVSVVGPNALAGVIALSFYSLSYLAKFYGDAIDGTDPRLTQTLTLNGLHPIQAFQYGLWTEVKPLLRSQTIWMLEYNIRSASIIGFVGAGGLGVQLFMYAEFAQWNKFSAVLISLFIVVLALEFISKSNGKNSRSRKASQ